MKKKRPSKSLVLINVLHEYSAKREIRRRRQQRKNNRNNAITKKKSIGNAVAASLAFVFDCDDDERDERR